MAQRHAMLLMFTMQASIQQSSHCPDRQLPRVLNSVYDLNNCIHQQLALNPKPYMTSLASGRRQSMSPCLLHLSTV